VSTLPLIPWGSFGVAVLLVSNVDYGSDDEDPDLAVVDGFLLKARLAGADLTVYRPQR
jgi:hypothetical protein